MKGGKMLVFCIGLLFSLKALSQVNSIVTANGKLIGWNVLTQSCVYQLMLTDKGDVIPVFFGAKAHAEKLLPQDRARGNGPFQLSEVPVRGEFADKIPIVEVVFSDNVRDCELVYEKAEVVSIQGRETLCITQRDKYYPFLITSYIRPLPEHDIIEKWIAVKNQGTKAIQLENLMSASVMLPPDKYYLTQHGGRWSNEFQLQKTELTAGIKTLQARDFTSFENTSWFAISNKQDPNNNNASVWFGQVHYSGNWRVDMESTIGGHLQIAGGINFWDTQWKLGPAEVFTTPKMSFGFTEKGVDEAARLNTAYIRKEILRPEMREKIRPVIYNSWYATGFDVNEENQLKLAKVAKEMGVELFVIDDGWFSGRKDDHAGLGDWFVDSTKFPHGLDPLIRKINDMGMQFGIWVEPEMVNPKSQLYKKHPDWVLNFPNRTKTEWRNQLTLNLAREDVYNYLLQAMTGLLKNHNIKFIKWDRNRGLTQPGWPSAPVYLQREVRLRYINNLYRLIDELQKRFPDVLFESCSSGGGRSDLGMLSKMDQTWVSDNTNPLNRLFIQYGYLSAYPANTMVCWVTGFDRSSINLSEEFMFDVAMQGVLGVGDNILKWNEKQIATARDKIAQYKSIRQLVQQGNLYRLRSPFEGNKISLEYVSPDKSEAVVFCYSLARYMEGSKNESSVSQQLLLQGLDPAAVYQLDDKEQTSASGEYLMKVGIPWPVTYAYRSTLLKLKKR
jgi:alpha-galactosidase